MCNLRANKFCNSCCVSRSNNVVERHQLIHFSHNKNILLHWSSNEWKCLKKLHWFRRFEKKNRDWLIKMLQGGIAQIC